MTHLTERFHLPGQYSKACQRLDTLVARHAQRLLKQEYWSSEHLEDIQEHAGHSHTYIRQDQTDMFENTEEYLYSRFKRCVYARVAQTLDSHTDEYNAYKFVTNTVREQKIRAVGWSRLRNKLFNDPNSPYIEWSVLKDVVEQLNNYYDTHGRLPDNYTDLVKTPEPNGTLPYAPDDYYIHDLTIEDSEVVFIMNAPDSLSPSSYHDWSEHEVRFPTHERFESTLELGELKAPTLHQSEHGYTLDVPVDIPKTEVETEENRVVSVDLGVKKQATTTIVESTGEDEIKQIAPPQFFDHEGKQKLFRLKSESESLNDRLAKIRENGQAHTDRFKHLQSEYKCKRRKERRLRKQIQHDIANQLVWLAIENRCETIVFESLGQLKSDDADGAVAWSISSWARGELLDLVEYKAELVGIDIVTVNPWGTSRYCPRCGEKGETVVAPDNYKPKRSGGHFYCSHCGYECDRDVVGALNVARKHFDQCKMKEANPVAYTEAGNHASFSSHSGSQHNSQSWKCARSTGVQSATSHESGEQDMASGRQTQNVSSRARPLIVKSGETVDGLLINRGSNMGMRVPRSSILDALLLPSATVRTGSDTTDSNQMLLNTTEN
jgi:IS605 OrfB family transposase